MERQLKIGTPIETSDATQQKSVSEIAKPIEERQQNLHFEQLTPEQQQERQRIYDAYYALLSGIILRKWDGVRSSSPSDFNDAGDGYCSIL